jgi:hypothetical protein
MPALAGGRHLLELMRHGFFSLLLYPGASWMLPAHFALQLSCITFDASTREDNKNNSFIKIGEYGPSKLNKIMEMGPHSFKVRSFPQLHDNPVVKEKLKDIIKKSYLYNVVSLKKSKEHLKQF